MLCRKNLNHTEYNLNSEKLKLLYTDETNYYFKETLKKRYYRVSRLENGYELEIYSNWLKI